MTWPAWALALLPWLKAKAWPWVLAHWKDLAVGLVVVLGWMLSRQSGKLSACEEALKAPAVTVGQAQEVSSSAKVHGSVYIAPGTPRPCPALGVCPPCPEIRVDFGAEAGTAVKQSQTASTGPAAGATAPILGLSVGAEYLSTPQRAYGLATADLNYGRYGVGAGLGDGVWRVGVKYQILGR